MSTDDELTIGRTRITLVLGDITLQQVDAVVNAANTTLLGGGGVDGAIHSAGGPSILAACRAVRRDRYPNGLPPGKAVSTPAGNLPAKWVIHTVGPVWHGGTRGEETTLASAYAESLLEATRIGARSVCLPAISTGAYRFPGDLASRIALRAAIRAAWEHPDAYDELRFALFSRKDLDCFRDALADIRDRPQTE